jgi:hypothetical protein
MENRYSDFLENARRTREIEKNREMEKKIMELELECAELTATIEVLEIKVRMLTAENGYLKETRGQK